jgi:hypothetical protein
VGLWRKSDTRWNDDGEVWSCEKRRLNRSGIHKPWLFAGVSELPYELVED